MKKIINTSKAPAPVGPYNQSTLFNGILFVSGQIALNPTTGELITDNIEAEGWDLNDDGVVYADEVQYRDYDVERERISASLSLDFRASDSTELYVRGVYSQFDDQEFRRRTTFKLDEEASSGDANSALFDDADTEWELITF